jgi:ribosomal protein S18 acetylase RimI-like enzyme
VAWVLTVADGSVGALYTLPDYRRRGLAKAVLAHRLGRMEGLPGFCHVEVTNGASETLWEGMGWRRGHRVNWVYADA